METSGQIATQIFNDLDRRLRSGENILQEMVVPKMWNVMVIPSIWEKTVVLKNP